MLCPIKVNSNTIELTVHTSFNCNLDLLYIKSNSIHPRQGVVQKVSVKPRSHGLTSFYF